MSNHGPFYAGDLYLIAMAMLLRKASREDLPLLLLESSHKTLKSESVVERRFFGKLLTRETT